MFLSVACCVLDDARLLRPRPTGVEAVLDDDITTHMCACTGGALSGLLVLIVCSTTFRDGIDDWQVLVNLLLSYYWSYTLLFTALEPLRASVKGLYVSFAQHPESLSQAFPLIYHRLARLSDSHVAEASSTSFVGAGPTPSGPYLQVV